MSVPIYRRLLWTGAPILTTEGLKLMKRRWEEQFKALADAEEKSE